jgi:putative NADPH-quinone reductase
MTALIVLAHPEPNGFNAAMANIARNALTAVGYNVAFSDLYQMGFEPRTAKPKKVFVSIVQPCLSINVAPKGQMSKARLAAKIRLQLGNRA